MKKFITVAGNIGVGKSTLVRLLCEQLKWEPFYEPVAKNPYIADFYDNMSAWSFQSQIFFLTHRLKIHQKLVRCSNSTIQDRSIYEDAEIFAHNLYLQGCFQPRDYETYHTLYLTLREYLNPPDLIVYLRASVPTLLKRIAQRSRNYEQTISSAYLTQLNVLYEDWINDFTLCPKLTIPADDLDYVAHPRHLELIKEKIEEKLTGKDEVIFAPEEVNKI